MSGVVNTVVLVDVGWIVVRVVLLLVVLVVDGICIQDNPSLSHLHSLF